MNTRLTLAQVRSALYRLVTPDDPTSTYFTDVINEVSERYINNGKWKGTLVHVTFPLGADGFITLPYNYGAALGGTYLRCPFPIFTEFHKYVENGPGNVEGGEFKWSGILIDMGDGYVTTVDIAEGDSGVLRIYSSATDNTEVVRVYGLDSDGQVLYDAEGNEGEEVTLTAPFVATTNRFSKVTGFVKPFTKNRVRLFVLPTTSGVEYQLAEYQPNETVPSYHRYQTGTVQPEDRDANNIRLLCVRRFIPVNAETDFVIPGNLAALRNGVQAWLAENATDYPSADAAWQRGIDFLNDEAKTYRGGGRPTINVEGFGLGTPFGNVV